MPRKVHFVFGLRSQDEPFHLVHYLAISSCLEVVDPDEVIVHCDELPYGIYWELIRPRITLRRVRPQPAVVQTSYDPTVAPYTYAHHADILRLDALLEDGGLYADIDTLFVAPPPDECWTAPASIGREADILDERIGRVRPSLSNAVVFAQPGADFIATWRERIESALDGSWSAHSCLLADDIARERPDAVHVESQRTFHHFSPTPDGIDALLVGAVDDVTGISAVHLCAHLWWDDRRRDFWAAQARDRTDRTRFARLRSPP